MRAGVQITTLLALAIYAEKMPVNVIGYFAGENIIGLNSAQSAHSVIFVAAGTAMSSLVNNGIDQCTVIGNDSGEIFARVSASVFIAGITDSVYEGVLFVEGIVVYALAFTGKAVACCAVVKDQCATACGVIFVIEIFRFVQIPVIEPPDYAFFGVLTYGWDFRNKVGVGISADFANAVSIFVFQYQT